MAHPLIVVTLALVRLVFGVAVVVAAVAIAARPAWRRRERIAATWYAATDKL